MEEEKKKPRRRLKFSPDEDANLRKLVHQYGESAWNKVAARMPGRNVRQCRERWKHYLSSEDTKKIPFTDEEDRIIIQKYIELGPKWTKIARFTDNRSDIQVKSRILKRINSFKNLIQNQPRTVTLKPVNSQQHPHINEPPKNANIHQNLTNNDFLEVNKEKNPEKEIIKNVTDFLFEDQLDFFNPTSNGNIEDQQNAGNVFYHFEF